MNKFFSGVLSISLIILFAACSDQLNNSNKTNSTMDQANSASDTKQSANYTEGSDYLLFERVRILDKVGFTEPKEAYSILLPRNWKHDGEIIWNAAGSFCDGTFKKISAASPDNKYSLEMLPDHLYSWSTNQQLMQMNMQMSNTSPYCSYQQPMDATQYLKTVFAPTNLGNPQVIKIEPNQAVVDQMAQANEKSRNELMQYGAGDVQFHQTAINAHVRWPDNTEGMIVLGVTVLETTIPNYYDGTYDKGYTTAIMKRTVFKYPAAESESARNQFSLIMGSFRTNPSWNDAVNQYWKDVRQKKNVVHIGKIKLMDEQTRQMGDEAVRRGNERLAAMDNQMRSWEARQSNDDRMHTNFIKAIREVEHYQDANGKVELASGYNHAWSRGDGSSFILTNDPNFDPALVLKDQAWKEMKKID